jgi:hypothetical protein
MKALAGLLFLIWLNTVLAAQQPDTPAVNRSPSDAQQAPPQSTQSPLSAAKQKAKPAKKEAAPEQLKRTRIDASMVGYIDPSAVQSEVRVRFDAGFNAPRPDRAEYFYAGCNGSTSCRGGI